MFDWHTLAARSLINAFHVEALRDNEKREQAKISHANWLARQYENWPEERRELRRKQIAAAEKKRLDKIAEMKRKVWESGNVHGSARK